MGDERERLSTRIGMLLRMNRRVRDAALEPRNLSPMLPPLQRWQAARLARGFDDLLADPRSAPAARFFLSDLYGDHDVSGRDRDVERVMPLMQRLLPAEMLGIAADAMELAVLSHALDLRTAAALEEHGAAAEADITEQGYAQAYRSVGRARLRVRQVGDDVRRAFETLLDGHPATGIYCDGFTPTIADCCLIPQVYNARRFGVDMARYPTIVAIEQACLELAAFRDAAPDRQPDAPLQG